MLWVLATLYALTLDLLPITLDLLPITLDLLPIRLDLLILWDLAFRGESLVPITLDLLPIRLHAYKAPTPTESTYLQTNKPIHPENDLQR